MKPNLNELETLARQAGVVLRAGFGGRQQVEHKANEIDLVTEVDHRSEAFILESIRRRYPSHQIIAEESGKHGENGSKAWYVDPLDGTVNFAHGIPIFSVSIAYAENGNVVLGVVYDPIRNECFTAERGEGAWMNGYPLQVSNANGLGQSLLVTGFPYDVWSNPNNNLDNHARFAVRTQGVRRLGSAALDLCYVAAGRFDGFWELRLSPWDVAAGILIAQEAGAMVTDVKGGEDYLSPTPSILAANPYLHPLMLAVLQE